jgi:hypothetical protein
MTNKIDVAACCNSYKKYLKLVGDATFIDIARTVDPACVSQPWENLEMLSAEFGNPKIIQIWTKNPRGVLLRGIKLLKKLLDRGSLILCQLTVTGFGPKVEPEVPWPVDWEGIRQLINFLGTPKAIIWRYDPVIPGISNLKTLEGLAKKFAEYKVTRAVYNWGEYGMELVRQRMGSIYDEIEFNLDKNVFSRHIERIGKEYGFDFMILGEGEKLGKELNLSSRGNWQYEWLVSVSDRFPSRDFMAGVFRTGCICAPSFDVGLEGQFQDCHLCRYCFSP